MEIKSLEVPTGGKNVPKFVKSYWKSMETNENALPIDLHWFPLIFINFQWFHRLTLIERKTTLNSS